MWTEPDRLAWVADLIARWLRAASAHVRSGRRNIRLVCTSAAIKEPLRQLLSSGEKSVTWLVRDSADRDAVALRHGFPSGIPKDRPLIYVLLWTEGSAAADKNAQSLRDISPVSVADILGDMGFEVPFERAVRDRCQQAAEAWDVADRSRMAEHLVAAWEGLRKALRLAPRSGESALRVVDSLDRWGDFLHGCQVEDGEWATWPVESRASLLLARLGSALPALGLFSMPALASVLGVNTDPKTKPLSPKKTHEGSWDKSCEEILLENAHWVSDPGALTEMIEGNKTLREQLDTLVRKGGVRLSSTVSDDDAAAALERFCRDYDQKALEVIEWLFYQDPRNRRSKSMGLNGLLIARGRREPQVHPLEKLAADTLDIIGKALPGKAEAASALVNEAKSDSRARPGLAAALSELGGLGQKEVPQSWREFLDSGSPPSPGQEEAFLDLSKRWTDIDAKAISDIVKARSLLVGIAQLLRNRHQPDVPAAPANPSKLCLRLMSDGTVEKTFAVDPSFPDELRRWIRDKIRPSVEEPEEAEEELPEGEEDTLDFAVSRITDRQEERLGSVSVFWTSMDRDLRRGALATVPRFRAGSLATGERMPSGPSLVRAGLRMDVQLGGGSPRLVAAWQKYVADVGFDEKDSSRFWEIQDVIAPVGSAAKALVDAWCQDVESGGAGNEAEDLEKERDAALEASDYPRAKALTEQIKKLKSQASAASPTLTVSEIRKLLAMETYRVSADDGSQRLVMSPHHPLVLRLRWLADRLLIEIIERLLNGTWPKAGHEDLDAALENWELPQPQHVYGDGPQQPLVFDGWTLGHAVFAPIGAGCDADAPAVGIAATREVVGRFMHLFPAASDRIRLRINGDPECRWAWALFGEGRNSPLSSADLELVTDLPGRVMTAFELGVLTSGDGLTDYEPGTDGEPPARRFRRVPATHSAPGGLHLSLLLADRLSEFRASWAEGSIGTPASDPWEPSAFFHETRPEVVDYRVVIQERTDKLSAAVEKAVARACGRISPIRECFSFDPAIVGPVLQKEQKRAQWLVLVSRQPAYRAVQAAGEISSLLDLSSRVEGGRPVHIAVSLGKDRIAECTDALRDGCTRLLGSAPVAPGAILESARSLAPGLALRALASNAIALEGLLGLLLTHAALARPGSLILSLDQHHRLLGGSGILADLVGLSLSGDRVVVSIAESKFTTYPVDEKSEPVLKAVAQILTTRIRLQRFVVQHPLAMRTRNEFVRAAIQQVHILGNSDRQKDLQRLIDALANPSVPLDINPPSQGAIHVWSWNPETAPKSTSVEGVPILIHDHQATKEAFQRLAGTGPS